MKKLFQAHYLFLLFWALVVLASIAILPDLTTFVTPLNAETKATSTPAWGRDLDHATNVTLVFANPHGPLTHRQHTEIQQKLADLQVNLNDYNLEQVQTAQTNPQTAQLFKSSDGAAVRAQVAVDFQANDLTTSAQRLRTALQIPGLQVAVTSPTLIQLGQQQTQLKNLGLAMVISLIISTILLGLIFRSLLVPLINLLGQAIVMLTGTSLAANSIASWHWPFSVNALPLIGLTTSLLITLLTWTFMHDYWATTALHDQQRPAALTTLTIQFKRWGATFLILIGIAAGLTRTGVLTLATSWVIILALGLTLLVVPSLNYALLLIFGDSVYWPGTHAWRPRAKNMGGQLSQFSHRHPAWALSLVGLGLIPGLWLAQPTVAYQTFTPTTLNHATNAERGQQLLTAHFGAGAATPIVITISNPKRLTTQSGLQTIDSLTTKLQHLPNVARVTAVTQPAGSRLPQYYLQSQLTALKTNLLSNQLTLTTTQKRLHQQQRQVKTLLTAREQRSWHHAQTLLTELQQTNQQLAAQLTKLDHSPTTTNWQRAQQLTTTAQALTRQLTTEQQHLTAINHQNKHQLTAITAQTTKLQATLLAVAQTNTTTMQTLGSWQASQIGQSFYLPGNAENNPDFLASLVAMTSRNGRQTQLTVTLKTPATSPASFATYDQLQQTCHSALLATPLQHAQLSYTGDTAQQAPVHQQWQHHALLWISLALAWVILITGFTWQSLSLSLLATSGLAGVLWSSWGLVQTGAHLLTNQAQLPWLAFLTSSWLITMHWLVQTSLALNAQKWRHPLDVAALTNHFYFTGQLIWPLTIFELGALLPLSFSASTNLQATSWLTITGILMSNLIVPLLLPAIITWSAQPPRFKRLTARH